MRVLINHQEAELVLFGMPSEEEDLRVRLLDSAFIEDFAQTRALDEGDKAPLFELYDLWSLL